MIIEHNSTIGQYLFVTLITIKMKRLLFLLVIFLPIPLAGQLFRSSNQQLIEDAICSGLVLYTHSYQLQDTTTLQRYGRNGQDDFGKSNSLAIKVKDGFIVNNTALTPWLFDSNFDRFRNEYRPISHKVRMREIRDTTICDCQVLNENIYSYNNTPFHRVTCSDTTNRLGFSLDTIPGKKTGWMVWVMSDEAIDSSDSLHSETYMIYKKEFTFNPDTVRHTIDLPQTDKHIWGGIYIIPKQTDIGQMTFFLSGIANQEDSGEWALYSPFFKEEVQNLGNDDVLTPVDAQSSPLPSKQSKRKTKKRK